MHSTDSPTEERKARTVRLLQETAQGSRAAFSELYRDFRAPLTRFAHRHLSSTELVEEAVNDTLLAVWLQAAKFRGESQASTWIMGIAARICMNTIRRNRNRFLSTDVVLEQLSVPSFVDALEHQQDLAKAISQLSAAQQATIELSYGQGFSCEEVAEITHRPVNTVKTRLHYARKSLRALLEDPAAKAGYERQPRGVSEPGLKEKSRAPRT